MRVHDSGMFGRAPILAGISALALSATGCAAVQPSNVEIRNGEAHSAEGAISIETSDWTYGLPLDGVRWVDGSGSWHEDGRPECLMPSEQTIPVTFAAAEVTVEGVSWRPVVWVSCEK